MTQIRTGQITPSSEAWQTWSPTLSNLTIGNGTLIARYQQVGKTVRATFSLVFGSTTSLSTLPTISLPVAANASFIPSAWYKAIGLAVFAANSGAGLANGSVFLSTAGVITPIVWNTSTTYATDNAIGATVPGTFATGYIIHLTFEYEAA